LAPQKKAPAKELAKEPAKVPSKEQDISKQKVACLVEIYA